MLVYLNDNDARVVFRIVSDLEKQMDLSEAARRTCEEDS